MRRSFSLIYHKVVIKLKKEIIKHIKLIIGLFICALGMVMTINANLGVAPWDVFHQGLAKVIGITLGTASIATGFVIVLIDISLGQPIGRGTIINMVLLGVFIDILMLNHLVPIFEHFLPSLIMLVLGMFVIGFGIYFYMSAELGSGPRDGLLVVLTKRTGKSIRVIKSSLEVIVVTIGFIMCGKLGIGTLILALFGGVILQFVFKTVKYDVSEAEHVYLKDDIIFLKEKITGTN